jgi:hypothetical protein
VKRKPERGDHSADSDGVRVVYDERRRLRGRVPLVAIIVTCALAVFVLRQREASLLPARAPAARERVAVNADSARIPARADDSRGGAGEAAVRNEENGIRANQGTTAGGRPRSVVARSSAELERAGVIHEKRPPVIDAREYIAALREGGETAGLAAFPLPGTRPPRSGVIVPADYELPEGFARHYQTTDDGRQLDPVLVVAPEYEIVDDAGNPVALIDDRIVPPEYVPPDLPVQMLDVPSEPDPGEEAR